MPSDMIDLAFDLEGSILPAGHQFLLWSEVARLAPELESVANVGILPLRGSASSGDSPLSRRARLTLRLPRTLAGVAQRLSGQQLDLAGVPLILGNARRRELAPYPTLHSQLVALPAASEAEFIAKVEGELSAIGLACQVICGLHQSISGHGRKVEGYSLAAHDLKPEQSLTLQREGLGLWRNFGCGIFVPHKSIPRLD